MAGYNATVTRRYSDRATGLDIYQYDVDVSATGDEWNEVIVDVPPDYVDAVLDSVVSMVFGNVATPHALTTRERVVGFLGRGGANSNSYPEIVSEELAGMWTGGGTVRDGWVAAARSLNLHVSAGDRMFFRMPPVDDNATPTGKVRLTIRYGYINRTKAA